MTDTAVTEAQLEARVGNVKIGLSSFSAVYLAVSR